MQTVAAGIRGHTARERAYVIASDPGIAHLAGRACDARGALRLARLLLRDVREQRP